MIVLDTNILSEPLKAAPNRHVLEWLQGLASRTVFTTAITIAELRRGAAILTPSRRRDLIVAYIRHVEDEVCRDRVLPFTRVEAPVFAEAYAQRRSTGRHVHEPDLMIAAIALTSGFALATRNVSDFVGLGLDLVDPFR